MSDGVPLEVSTRLNHRRRELGLSVAQLAHRIDMSRSNVDSLMSGKRSPTPEVAERLITALDLDPDFAAELRALHQSHYKSGFAGGEITLTREPTAPHDD